MTVSKKMIGFSQGASWIRKMFEEGVRMKARFGEDQVFDFSLGNPDLPPPPEFDQTLRRLADGRESGLHRYMPNAGYPQVRGRIAAKVSAEQGVKVDGEGVVMTCGAAGGLNVILKALLDPGDEVIIIAPYFVEYLFYIDNHGGTARVVAAGQDFGLDLPALARAVTSRTKAIIINSPNNPTGQIYPDRDLAELGRILSAAGARFGTPVYLIADEPYRKIVFDGHQTPSVFQHYRHSLVVSSFSKDLSLPGERIGFIACHPELTDLAELMEALTLANRILGFVNAPALMQRAVLELLDCAVDCAAYARRRELFCRVLAQAGYNFLPPKGAFYLFPKSPLADELRFIDLLKEHRILAVPGRGFGTPGYFRLAFCVSEETIARSAAAFKAALEASRRV